MDDAQCLSPFLPGTPLHSLSAPLHLPLQAHPWPRCQTKGAIAGPHVSTCPRPATPSSLKCAHLVSRTLLGLFLTGTAATSHSPVLPLISCSTLTLGFSFSPACPPPHHPPPPPPRAPPVPFSPPAPPPPPPPPVLAAPTWCLFPLNQDSYTHLGISNFPCPQNPDLISPACSL